MKKVAYFFVLIVLLSQLVFASSLSQYKGEGEIIPIDDDFYVYTDILFVSSGNAIPSTSRPWTVSEAKNELEKIDETSLSEDQRHIYDILENTLKTKENNINLTFVLSPEVYAHTNTNFNKEEMWNYGYEDRKHLGSVSLDNSTGGFHGHFELSIGQGMVSNQDTDNEMSIKEYAEMINGKWEGLGTQIDKNDDLADTIKVLSRQYNYTTSFLFNIPSTSNADLNMPRRAYLNYAGSNFSFGFYKDRKTWGYNKTGNFVFDSHNSSYTTVTLKTFNEKFSFEYTYMMPEQYRGGVNSSEKNYEDYQRIFAAHRIEVKPSSKLTFALSENVMYRFYGIPDISYLNPATFFHNNLNSHQFNALASVEVAYSICPGVLVYGQIGIDQGSFPGFEDPTKEDQAMGFSLGVEYSQIKETSLYRFSLEGLYTTPALYRPTGSSDFIINYNYLRPTNYYRYPFYTYIGYEYGGDNIEIKATADYYKTNLHIYGSLDLRIQGEYGMFDEYHKPLRLSTPSGKSELIFTGNIGTEYSLDLFNCPFECFFDLAVLYHEKLGTDIQTSIGASIEFSV